MFRRALLSLAAALLLGMPLAPQALLAQQSAAKHEKKECIVYITKTGQRYHRDGCSSLRRSRIPMTRTEALKRGLTLCRRCGGSDCER
jgi:hypothetical protein